MKRTFVALGMSLLVVMNIVPAHADLEAFMQGSRFCDGQGRSAVADGPASQLDVTTQVFGPALAAACPKESGMLTYLGRGDRAGIEAILDHDASVNFGTGDVPLATQEWLEAWLDLYSSHRRNRVSTFGLHQIPLFVNVLSVGYSITACRVPQLNLRSEVLSLIFAGVITKWDDPLLVQDNPLLAACKSVPIALAKRAEYAGSTYTFKDYLSKRNPSWNYYKQPDENQTWPTVTNNCPARGEDGMADCILGTQNSIGYLQYHVAKVRGVPVARIDSIGSETSTDSSKRFLAPSASGCTQAADSAPIPPPMQAVKVGESGTPTVSPTAVGDWNAISLTDPTAAGYALCSFSYAFMFQEIQHAYFGDRYTFGAGRLAVDYLWVALSASAQAKVASFDFGSLPQKILDSSRAGVQAIRFQS